jgi:hypothetical protein
MTARVNVSTNGTIGDVADHVTSMTPDGRFVVIETIADLTIGSTAVDNNGLMDVYVRDTVMGTTQLVSGVSLLGVLTAQGGSDGDISADGTRVAFVSTYTMFATGQHDFGNTYDVFLAYMTPPGTGPQAFTLVSHRYGFPADTGPSFPGDGGSYSIQPSISANGQCVAFASTCQHIAINQAGTGPFVDNDFADRDIFRFDVATGVIKYVSWTSIAGSPAGQLGTHSGFPVISATGDYVAFQSDKNLDGANDLNLTTDVYYTFLGVATPVSVLVSTQNGVVVSANGASVWPSMSDDGLLIGFHSSATNLVANDTTSSCGTRT